MLDVYFVHIMKAFYVVYSFKKSYDFWYITAILRLIIRIVKYFKYFRPESWELC